MDDSIPVISDPQALLERGIVSIPLPDTFDCQYWARELSQVTPEILTSEGDGEYAFYRNILEEPDFPFGRILQAISSAIEQYFGVKVEKDLRLDDAFCVHYNADQHDSSGSKHTDPSDITVNICLEKSSDTEGSHVLFYGTRELMNGNGHDSNAKFQACQTPGYATIHWGDHPHETMALKKGRRTNIVMTFWFKDESKSKAAQRTCYFT